MLIMLHKYKQAHTKYVCECVGVWVCVGFPLRNEIILSVD